MISRTGADNYENLDRHRDAAILINATPVGMYPDTGRAPLDLRGFPELEGVLDRARAALYREEARRLQLENDREERGAR